MDQNTAQETAAVRSTAGLGRGEWATVRVPTMAARQGIITGQSRDKRCWYVRLDGLRTPMAFAKDYVERPNR